MPSAGTTLLLEVFLFLFDFWLKEDSFFKLLFLFWDNLDLPFLLVSIENVPYFISFSRLSLYSYFLFLITPKFTLRWSIWLSTVRFNEVSLESFRSWIPLWTLSCWRPLFSSWVIYFLILLISPVYDDCYKSFWLLLK